MNTQKQKKLVALLSTALALSFTAGLSACKKNETQKTVDQSEVTTSRTADESRIKNGSFEFDDDNEGKKLIVTSPTGWSSYSATTSKTASGIVNTDTDKWKDLTSSVYTTDNEDSAKSHWNEMTAYDKLKFIEDWEKADSDNDKKNLDFYTEEYNVEFKDLPSCDNPGTHDGTSEDKNVLMIHNHYSDNKGTAQRYTSSSTITLPAGTSAEFSVWVKTSNLTSESSAGESQKVVSDRGAYIGITRTVGGTTLDQVQVKNIDTEAVNPSNENNGWVQYTFYLKGATYSASTFTVVLGLGQGSSTNKWEYVDGYAFFDDAKCKISYASDFATNTASLPSECIVNSDSANVVFEADKTFADKFKYAIDFDMNVALADQSLSLTYKKTQGGGAVETGDTLTYSTYSALESTKDTFGKVWDKDFANYPFGDASNILMMYAPSGYAYTATASTFSLPADANQLISLWVKTSDLTGGYTGAGITVKEADEEKNEVLSSYLASSANKVDIDGTDGKIEDIYDGWQQVMLFLSNETDDTKSITVSLTYGSTADTVAKTEYRSGYAAFANIQTTTLTEKEAKRFSSSTYFKSIVYSDDEVASKGFDTVAGTPTNAIETGFANAGSYKGVYGGSRLAIVGGSDTSVNAYPYAGLLNKDYVSAYTDSANTKVPDGLKTLLSGGIMDGAKQPLVIYNTVEDGETATRSYGYIGENTTLSGYATVSLRVKASVGAKAHIYLIDTDKKETMTYSTPTVAYWYDADGNVCAKDPTAKDFDKKKDVAFTLNNRGLYEVNKAWSGYDAQYEGKTYFNLSAYEKDDEGNLITAKNGVQYNYDPTVWRGEGTDGIAFYAKKDGENTHYYAYKNLTQEVFDLSSVASLAKRYENNDSYALEYEAIGTGNWEIYTFYVSVGEETKNYRLEVWSGDREGNEPNADGSYVMFDMNPMSSLSADTWTTLLNEVYDRNGYTAKEFKEHYAKPLAYYAYSFYDSGKFLRYDETLDKNEIGNSYKDYDATTYSEDVAYLYEEFENSLGEKTHTTFVNFSVTDVNVPTDAEEEEKEETPEEETTEQGNIWLFASSLILAGVLLLAVVSIVVQKVVRKNRKTRAPKVKKSNK